MNVTDLDIVFHDEVDQFVISLNLPINNAFGDAMTYRGTCNRDTTLELRIKISQSTSDKSSAYEMSQTLTAVSIIATMTSFLFFA